MPKITKLPPYNAITGKYITKQGHYRAYTLWRNGAGYAEWRKTQWRIQRGRCYYCKVSLVGRKTNVEHVIAQSLGGKTVRKNMVIACPGCNKDKGSSKASKQLVKEVSYFNASKRKLYKKKTKKQKLLRQAKADYYRARSQRLI